MIPQRITLKGFLSYKDEQEVTFDGSSLWMLTGLNGSGKSTIFDGLTFALFGQHRGGSQSAIDLINKDSERANVDFEFTLREGRYVAHRTVQRTKTGAARTTFQIYRCLSDGTREPVDGTHQKTGYDEWMAQHIGLSYDVFTSSVLLLQGKAEKLLDAGPKGRHEVLAGIVDLERYQRLHTRADAERKTLKDHIEGLDKQVCGLPVITPLELAVAAANIETAETARQQAQAEVERLQILEFQAQNWKALQSRLSIARQRWEQAQKLVDDAAAIEQDVKRLQELRAVLPDLQTIVEQRGQIQKSESDSQELEKRRRKLEDQLAAQDHALGQTRQKLETLRGFIEDDEQKHREIAAKLLTIAALLEKLKEHESQASILDKIHQELAKMPADPSAELRQVREAQEELTALAQAVPIWTRLHNQREDLRVARTREQAASKMRETIQARGEQYRAEVDRFKPTLDEALKARQEADSHATATKTLLDQARRQLGDLEQLDGAKVCPHCGQDLTESHVREEKVRRQKEVNSAEETYRSATEARKIAKQQDEQARQHLAELEKQLAEAREQFREQRTLAEGATKDVERLHGECGQIYSELSDTDRPRVAPSLPTDWLATTFPTTADLDAMRRQANELSALRRRFKDAEKVLDGWKTLKGRESAVQESLVRLEKELPTDRLSVRGGHARLEADEKALDLSLRARRGEAETAQKELDRLTKERGQIDKQLMEQKGKLATEEATRQLCRQTLNRALQDLPEAWRTAAERIATAELFRLRSERDTLVEKQTDERGRQLEQARIGLNVMQQDLATLEEEARKFPDDARQEPEHVAGVLRIAQQTANQRADELGEARQRRTSLEDQCRRREKLESDKLQAEIELRDAKLLVELLGRERLQLHLVRKAEQQVVDHANAVLDRLSSGQLYLRLVGEAGGEGGGEKALQLEAHNRVTGERPINVAFLSGSQKFRVAVSLALGLGQYASRQHRPIESVIIDEGFGCLDKYGRQAMIQELQNLRGQLRCILLVSHQDEFADAFADGYRFELANGSTRVTRFER